MKSDLIAWSTFLKTVRHFFDDRSVIEVTTQPLSHYGNPDPYVDPLKTSSGFLHTSPEFEMKQLLAKGALIVTKYVMFFAKKSKAHGIKRLF